MLRNLLLTGCVVAVLAAPAEAKRVARAFTPVEKFARAEVVVTGTVSAVEKEMVNAVRFRGDAEKVPHKVVVIKIDKPLLGGDGVTHVKVGFVPPPPADPNVPVRPVRGGFRPVDLKEGQEGLYFLTKHPSGEFYTIAPMMAPLDPKADGYKAQAEQVTRAAAALADPVKALKAEKAADRYAAATALLLRYRALPEDGRETETVKVPAEESKLILKALAEADWKKPDADGVNPMQAFYQLGLNDAAGWKQPQVKPGADFQEMMKEAFVKWLDGAGKDYQIQKNVPKKK
jgi:hypothetical protein